MDNQFYNTEEVTVEVTSGHYEPQGNPAVLVFREGDVTAPPSDDLEGDSEDNFEDEFTGEEPGQG